MCKSPYLAYALGLGTVWAQACNTERSSGQGREASMWPEILLSSSPPPSLQRWCGRLCHWLIQASKPASREGRPGSEVAMARSSERPVAASERSHTGGLNVLAPPCLAPQLRTGTLTFVLILTHCSEGRLVQQGLAHRPSTGEQGFEVPALLPAPSRATALPR